MKKWLVVVCVAIVALFVAGFAFREQLIVWFFSPMDSSLERVDMNIQTSVVAENLATPWSISFLANDGMLVTQREGKLTRIGGGQTIEITGVRETSEGGLLGLALDPEFDANKYIYLYYTTDEDGKLTNRVDRYKLANDSVSERTEIISGIPAASNHNGGAIAFGPEGKLYVTTGDAAQDYLAQDRDSLAGKILRLNPDGSQPEGNPFNNFVWSYGHRNPQGIAWDDNGRLWSVEHGPSGIESGKDELNLITKGGNYGWPEITGEETRQGMIAPVAQSGSDDTWAPSGLAHLDGVLYFAGLRGQALYRAAINDSSDDVELQSMFTSDYGRLRAVTEHKGDIYFSTSNRDGRGSPADSDDRIIRLRGIN